MESLAIPKRYDTLNRCLRALVKSQEDGVFQSELKRLVYAESWRKVVKREFALWNHIVSIERKGCVLVVMTPRRNPASGRGNEVLFALHPSVTIVERPTHFLVLLRAKSGGAQCETETRGCSSSSP